MEPKVTVVVPSFNVAKYIRQCLDSILSQTMKEIEVIVVDAFSTDGTREIIEEYAVRDSRIRLVDDVEKSTGYAKNAAIDMARAPYYAIVESDDYIEPDMFEKLYRVAENTGVDFVKSNFSTFIGEGDQRFDFPKSVSLYGDYEKIINPKESPDCFKWIMFEWLGLYRVSFLRYNHIRHNESKGAAFQDTGFWFLTFSHADSVYLMRESFYHYRCDNPYASVKDPKKAMNICNEYDFIYNELSKEASVWKDIRSCYCRGFFYDNYVVFNRIDDELKPALVSRMREILKRLFAEGVDKDIFNRTELEKVERLLRSEKEFMDAEDEMSKERIQNEKRLLDVIDHRDEIIIYGAGSYGANLHFYLRSKGYEVTAYADGDSKKHGRVMNGKKILSLAETRKLYKQPLYLIANREHARDISCFLKESGIDDRDMYICDISKIVKILI